MSPKSGPPSGPGVLSLAPPLSDGSLGSVTPTSPRTGVQSSWPALPRDQPLTSRAQPLTLSALSCNCPLSISALAPPPTRPMRFPPGWPRPFDSSNRCGASNSSFFPFLAPPPLGVLPLHGPPLGLSTKLPDAHDTTTGPTFPCSSPPPPRTMSRRLLGKILTGTVIVLSPKHQSGGLRHRRVC